MQPIGLYVWLSNRINDQGKVEESHLKPEIELDRVDALFGLECRDLDRYGLLLIRASIVLVLSVIVSPMRQWGRPAPHDPPLPGAMDLLDCDQRL